MKKISRYILRFLVWCAALIIVVWLGLGIYIHFNKDKIIQKIRTEVNKKVKDRIAIGDIRIDLFSTFPNIAVRLNDVTIKDSLWEHHHHHFFKAKKVFIRLQFLGIFSGKIKPGKVIVENASLYSYTDTTGYTNMIRMNKEEGEKKSAVIPDLLFKNTRFTLENQSRYKLHDIEARTLKCKMIRKNGEQVMVHIDINSVVHGLAFNTQKGSYLKEKALQGNFSILVTANQQIHIKDVKLKIDKHPFIFNGTFSINNEQSVFNLSIQTKNATYKKIATLFSDSIKTKLNLYDLSTPVNIVAKLDGPMAYRKIPLVDINMEVKNAVMKTPAGEFRDCSFMGVFTNQADASQPRIDENSRFSCKKFRGQWSNIPLTANLVEVTNIKNPFLVCDLQSSFKLQDLHGMTGSNTLQLLQGTGLINIVYRGPVKNTDSVQPVLEGYFGLKDAMIAYVPRNLLFKNCNANIAFQGYDMLIEQLKAQVGETTLSMKGTVKNLLALIYNSPEKLILDANITTPVFNISDFMSYLGKRSKSAPDKAGTKKTVMGFSDKIDRMLEQGVAQLNIRAGKVLYKKFVANDVSAQVSLVPGRALFDNVQFSHADGTVGMNAVLTDGPDANPFKLHVKLANIDIPQIFYAFNDFNQDAITNRNMKGRLTAAVDVSGNINNKTTNIISDLNGKINFSIKNAELNNFEPLEKIAEVIFKKRDFSNVRFAELKNTLDINGSAIYINKMEITSNVFTMFVEGWYDPRKGTDMYLRVPLRNLKKRDEDTRVKNTGKIGSNILLRAKTGDDGKLGIKLVLFKTEELKKP